MKKYTFTLLTLLLGFGLTIMLSSFSSHEDEGKQILENTPGTVLFTVKTKTEGGNFAPRHVLAIWVQKDGEFVKTRKAMANQRKQYLYTWKAISNYNVVDAITGSTLNSHQTHTVEWDCTDLDGNVVVDGDYTMFIEFTEKHGQGPLFSIDFEKGSEAISLDPPDEAYFINMEFSFEPEIVLVADFSSNVQETCMGETVIFTDNSTGATAWEWDFGADANPNSALTQGPHEVTYASNGSKTVSLTIDQGVTQTKANYINVLPDALASFAWTQQSRTITFTNNSQNAVSYSWDFGDGNTSTEENPVYTYAEDGAYEVSLTAISEMCSDNIFTEEIVINTVGVPEMNVTSAIGVFPNPGNGIFHLSSTNDLMNVELKIFDVQGQIVFIEMFEFIQSGQAVVTGNNQLVPGMYFLDIKTSEENLQQKLLVR